MKKILYALLAITFFAGCDPFDIPEPANVMTCGEMYRYRMNALCNKKFTVIGRKRDNNLLVAFLPAPTDRDTFIFHGTDAGAGLVTVRGADTIATFTWKYEVSATDSCRAYITLPVYIPYVGYQMHSFDANQVNFLPHVIYFNYPVDLYPDYTLELRPMDK